ncbi:MAG: hypothetical protein K8S00_00110 [Bacteroidales bacterium]|nr:hypothetical protein [Bacteroidales bacterium]
MKRVLIILLLIVFSLFPIYSQTVKSRVFLQGAYQSGLIMSNSLNSLIPASQPYDTIPWDYSGNEIIDSIPSNMIDWVLVELRDNANPSLIISRRAALLLDNGEIVDTNLVASVNFGGISPGNYYLCIYHRNHMPVMSAIPLNIPNAISYNFSDTLNFPSYGGSSQALIELESGVFGMIAGDVNKDGILKYSGPANDRGAILQYIVNQNGSSSITITGSGYREEDLNMDSTIQYSGPGNDPSLIIQNLFWLAGSTSISSVYHSMVPAGIPSFQCGDTLLDQRDWKKYSTVQIGTQCWMAENLNVGTVISGSINQSDNGTLEKFCYEDNLTRCDEYGGLYQWDEMMEYTSSPGIKGICPDGWHIPTDNELKVLEGAVDSQYGIGDPEWDIVGNRGFDASCNLIETGTLHWPVPNTCATNSSGFSVLPGGGLIYSGVFYYFSIHAFFWTSSEQTVGSAWSRALFNNSNQIQRIGLNKNQAYSVRCLKN